ncbi:MAG: 3-deoxy-8-phosphooctulonate synthase [Bacteroidales bacterium]|nr:3-deoxy-8-phosphooctulonate synthase [Bacteroidales bacterium]
MKIKHLHNLSYADSENFFLIAGPCVIENETMPLHIAETLCEISQKHQIPFIFKASYKKANRSSLNSFTGIGDEKGLRLLQKIKETFQIPVLTDIHTAEEAKMASEFVDILQIPAFLCRQTELLLAAAETGKTVNVKKGQFLSPESMKFVVEKIQSTGNRSVWLTERGSMFGYGDLVVDFRGIPAMQSMGVPVVLDCTHSLQQPNQAAGVTGGRPDMIETIAKAGIAVGADGLFIETHPDLKNAKSDAANMLDLKLLEGLMVKLIRIRESL